MRVGNDFLMENDVTYKTIAMYRDAEGGHIILGMDVDADTGGEGLVVCNMDKDGNVHATSTQYFEDDDVSFRFAEAKYVFQTRVATAMHEYWRIVVFG